MIQVLATHGIALDADHILKPSASDPGKAPGRPWVARALVAAGHVGSIDEAFDKWLERGRPAFVARRATSPEEVFEHLHEAGGLASLAHPGVLDHDEWLERFAMGGLDAIEAYHSDHESAATERYLEIAGRLGLAVTGGSDYHGEGTHGSSHPGSVSLPRVHYDRLIGRRAVRFGRSAIGRVDS
jgi:predicted metal-dependent phosphoesterase TrpH